MAGDRQTNAEPARAQGKTTDEPLSSKKDTQHVTDFARDRPKRGCQIGAWVLWLLGVALEAVGVLQLTGTFDPQWSLPVWEKVLLFVLAIAVGFAFALLGQKLWSSYVKAKAKSRGKKSSSPSRVGVVMSTVAFVPMVLYFATAKNVDKLSVVLSVVAAVIAAAAIGALAVLL